MTEPVLRENQIVVATYGLTDEYTGSRTVVGRAYKIVRCTPDEVYVRELSGSFAPGVVNPGEVLWCRVAPIARSTFFQFFALEEEEEADQEAAAIMGSELTDLLDQVRAKHKDLCLPAERANQQIRAVENVLKATLGRDKTLTLSVDVPDRLPGYCNLYYTLYQGHPCVAVFASAPGEARALLKCSMKVRVHYAQFLPALVKEALVYLDQRKEALDRADLYRKEE